MLLLTVGYAQHGSYDTLPDVIVIAMFVIVAITVVVLVLSAR